MMSVFSRVFGCNMRVSDERLTPFSTANPMIKAFYGECILTLQVVDRDDMYLKQVDSCLGLSHISP